jgi:hypothetical protein
VRQGVLRLPACFRDFDQWPEDLARQVERLIERWADRNRPLLVTGVRTSGSYLAPLVAAALRARGRGDAHVLTLRPAGAARGGMRTSRRRRWSGLLEASGAGEHVVDAVGVDRDRVERPVAPAQRIWQVMALRAAAPAGRSAPAPRALAAAGRARAGAAPPRAQRRGVRQVGRRVPRRLAGGACAAVPSPRPRAALRRTRWRRSARTTGRHCLVARR